MTTKYNELRAAFGQHLDCTRKYVRENDAIAHAIVYGFGKYAEIPSHFEKFDGTDSQRRPYLTVYSLDDYDQATPESFLQDAITHNNDGTFSFAFGVTLERSEGSFPKQIAVFKAKCTRSKDKLLVDLDGRSVECPKNSEGSFDVEKVHDAIFDMLKEYLSLKPGEDNAKPKYGFQVRDQ